ncbi:MAG: hypothetical protein ACR2OZ_13890 [Verrucomicrobiales bacterium]
MNFCLPLFRAVSLCFAGSALVSCSLPPRVAWQRIQGQRLVPALFNPKWDKPHSSDVQIASGTSWGSAHVEGHRAPAEGNVIPSGESFAGKIGFVYSPHTHPKKLVNVAAFRAGEQVLCPYTLEPFVVPSFAQGPAMAKSGSLLPLTFGSAAAKTTIPSDPIEVVSRDAASSPLPTPREPPYGTWVEGKPGFVFSPFAAKHQLVDVTGMDPGVEVRCPYTRQIFRVPHPPGLDHPGSLPDLPAQAEPITSFPINPPPVPTPESSDPPPSTVQEPDSSNPASPSSSPVPQSTSPPVSDLPVAKWIEGKPGLVQSPFGEPGELVDVTGKEAGSRVICPFTGKAFLVPPN